MVYQICIITVFADTVYLTTWIYLSILRKVYFVIEFFDLITYSKLKDLDERGKIETNAANFQNFLQFAKNVVVWSFICGF